MDASPGISRLTVLLGIERILFGVDETFRFLKSIFHFGPAM